MPGHAGRNVSGLFEYDRALQRGEVQREVLLSSDQDALRVSGIWLGADAATEGDISDGGGQYLIVLAGSYPVAPDEQLEKRQKEVKIKLGPVLSVNQSGL